MLGLNEIREHGFMQGTKWRSQYSDYATIWIIEGGVFESFHIRGTLFFSKTSRPPPGPTQLAIQCVRVALAAGVRRSERDADQLV